MSVLMPPITCLTLNRLVGKKQENRQSKKVKKMCYFCLCVLLWASEKIYILCVCGWVFVCVGLCIIRL